MICPNCQSKDVKVMGWQSHEHQVTCDTCKHLGTYYEFGLAEEQNIGLVTQFEGGFYSLEQELYDASDPGSKLAITVHVIGDQSVCNTWIMRYGQWLKMQPERVVDTQPSPGLLQGEIMRLATNKGSEIDSNDRLTMAVLLLQDVVSSMIGQPDTTEETDLVKKSREIFSLRSITRSVWRKIRNL